MVKYNIKREYNIKRVLNGVGRGFLQAEKDYTAYTIAQRMGAGPAELRTLADVYRGGLEQVKRIVESLDWEGLGLD